jgi:hypothetical protein
VTTPRARRREDGAAQLRRCRSALGAGGTQLRLRLNGRRLLLIELCGGNEALLQQFARPRQISLLHGGGGPGRTALRRRAVQRPRIIAVVETQQRLARMDAAAKVDPALDDPARHFETDLAFEGGPDFAGIGCADAGIGAECAGRPRRAVHP